MTPIFHDDPDFESALSERFDPDVAEVLRLSAALCSVAGITVPASATDFPALSRTQTIAADYARAAGLKVTELAPGPETPYPFLIVGFADVDLDDPTVTDVMSVVGHLDVVPPREADQFRPRLEGTDLYARGAADMKTVVATWLVWMARRQQGPGPRPPLLALISSCEENGSAAPHHMGSVLDHLRSTHGVEVRFALVGERTGELEWMEPEPLVGPICKENRSWRWLRYGSASASGLPALYRIAEAVRLGRTTVADLNAHQVPAEKASRQPGVRSGFVNPFAHVQGDADDAGGVWIDVFRPPGASIHSAAAKASDRSLIELLAAAARDAEGTLVDVALAGLELGTDGNFNSYDGSGRMRLRTTSDRAAVDDWAAQGRGHGLEIAVADTPQPITSGPTYFGLDIRELLDHRDAVQTLTGSIQAALWDDVVVVSPSARPAWRCPAEHPDLVKLEAAYQAVVGQPSPDLVKLHGNDGGSLAERQQAASPEAARAALGHAVVFGQVGKRPHGPAEFHRCTSVRPYWGILDRWLDQYA